MMPVVMPAAVSIPVGNTQQFQAVLQYFIGTSQEVTNDATWSVTDDTVATVDNSVYKGLAKGLKPGQTVISATYGGMTGKAVLTITAPGGGTENDCLVDIAVVGKNGELLYRPGSVLVSKTNKWGLTVLGALEATGLPYDYAEYSFGVLVTCISGQCNEGQQGWMYKFVNKNPGGAANQEPIKNGDKIIWWYSSDPNSPGPNWDDLIKLSSRVDQETIPANLLELNRKLPVALQASDDSLAALEKVEDLLGWKGSVKSLDKPDEKIKTIAVVGNGKPVDLVALRKLKEELAKNKVELGQKITADLGAVLADANAEIALAIPAGALKSDAEITVQKTGYAGEKDGGNGSPPAAPPGYRQISAIYSFGPEGTTFDEPATLSLRLVIPPLVRPENIALAWYDKDEGQWKAVPAVVDLSKGLILARLKHFSDFAVFAREEKKSFADVTGDSFGWAKETIETLAGAGIAAGVDGTRFEPGRPVTRAEFTALLVKALAIPIPEKPAAVKAFKDVQDGDWFAGAATAAAQAGLVKGYADGTFRPHSAISREEAAAILARVMNLATTEQKLSFADGDKVSSWARASVAAAAAYGLVKGFPDGTFKPAAALGRAECAAVVYRMLAID
ncbi:MAG: S-layer homology domain-containing protein [Armatimonadetes bacterium]|nr:S-layer homology domain-containing protein [Armatimonadota bacterium]